MLFSNYWIVFRVTECSSAISKFSSVIIAQTNAWQFVSVSIQDLFRRMRVPRTSLELCSCQMIHSFKLLMFEHSVSLGVRRRSSPVVRTQEYTRSFFFPSNWPCFFSARRNWSERISYDKKNWDDAFVHFLFDEDKLGNYTVRAI